MPINYSGIPFTSRREAERFAYGIGGQRAPGAAGGVTAVGTSGGVPAAGTLPGAPAFGYVGAYGGIPQVPSPGASQAAAIAANLGNTGQLFNLAGQTNQFNNAQALAGLQANLPGYDAMAAQASQNIAGNLAGNVAPDVWRNLQQMNAERTGMTGIGPDAPNANAALLRSVYDTTSQLQNLGQQQLSQAVARTPVGPQFNPASQYISTNDWQQAQMAANLYNSAPIPAEAAAVNLDALRSGLRSGTGSTQMSNSDKLLSMLPRSAPTSPSRPSSPQSFSPRSQPTAPGRSYDPNAYSSSRPAIDTSVTEPGMLGGYNYNPNTAGAGAEVAPELQKWAEGDFSDIFPTFGAGFLGL
jgi:hypothetical protein